MSGESTSILDGLDLYVVAMIVSGIFSWSAAGIGVWLIVQHLRHYSNPSVQKPTVRIILMIPVSLK